MKNKRRFTNVMETVLSFLLITVVVIVALITPSILFRLEDNTLFTSKTERRQLGGSFGEKSYLVWALHVRKRAFFFYNETEVEPNYAYVNVVRKMDEMVKAEILSINLTQMFHDVSKALNLEAAYKGMDEYGFESTQLSFSSKDEQEYLEVYITTEGKTGKVVDFFLHGNCWNRFAESLTEKDLPNLEKYIQWLGLAEAEGWGRLTREQIEEEEDNSYTNEKLDRYSIINTNDMLKADMYIEDKSSLSFGIYAMEETW